ncbi:MAG: hypothetical protein U1E17_09175 [Geminicoccaceae bacterium]
MALAREAQAKWLDQIKAGDTATIAASPELLQFAIAGGGQVFKGTIARPAGLGEAGQGRFPTLADDDWLWGGSWMRSRPRSCGIRNGAADAHDSAMPAFGADGLLNAKQIADVTQFVLQAHQPRHRSGGGPSVVPASSPRTAPPATAMRRWLAGDGCSGAQRRDLVGGAAADIWPRSPAGRRWA